MQTMKALNISHEIANTITLDLKTQTLAELALTINQLPQVYTKYSVSIVNRRINEKTFRTIIPLLQSIGLVNLDMTYDTWATGLNCIHDTTLNKTVGIAFESDTQATQWLNDTYKSVTPLNSESDDRFKRGLSTFLSHYTVLKVGDLVTLRNQLNKQFKQGLNA